MKTLRTLWLLLGLICLPAFGLAAPPAPPVVAVAVNGLDVSVSWNAVAQATGYTLYYAPYPFAGMNTIGSVPMGTQRLLSVELWPGAAYYVAVKAANSSGESDWSNIELFSIPSDPRQIDDDGDGYTEAGGDCNDGDAATHPGAVDGCGDGIDQNCNGSEPVCPLVSDFTPGQGHGSLSPIGSGLAFTAFTSPSLAVELGRLDLPLTRRSDQYRYVNVLVDFDGNGRLGAYPAAGQLQKEWVVKDLPVLALATSYGLYVDLVDPAVTPGDPLAVRVLMTASPFGSGSWDGSLPAGSVAFDAVVTVAGREWAGNARPEPTSVGGGGANERVVPRAGAGEAVEDVSGIVGDSLYRSGMPDANQSLNTCVPNSIANNISWLARKCGFTSRLTPLWPGETIDIATNEGAAELGFKVLDAYTDLNLYDPQKGITGTAGATTFDGAMPGLKDNILRGKNKSVADNNLPIDSSIIQIGPSSTLFAEIKKAMAVDKCAVELVMEVVDKNGQTIGGHAVSVAGFAEFQLGNATYRGLTLHNGDSENADSRNPGNDTHILDGNTIKDLPFVDRTLKVKPREARLKFAVKQCCREVQTSCAGFSGQYQLVSTAITDTAGHLPFTGNPFTGQTFTVGTQSGVTVSGPAPFVNVAGTGTASGSGQCTFNATGSGTVAGFPNVSVRMTGTFSSSGLTGTYVMGVGGELPGGQPITFSFASQ